MIYHVFPGNAEHLVLKMIEFFSSKIHAPSDEVKYFILFSDAEKKNNYNVGRSIFFIDSNRLLIEFIFNVKKGDIVVLHSTLYGIIWKYLFFRPSIWPRFIWIAWGGDFYCDDFFNPTTLKNKIHNYIKKLICNRICAICTLVPGDYDLISNVLGCKNKYFRVFYASYSFDNCKVSDGWYDVKACNKPLRVLVGNSASETNRHMEIFDLLHRFRDNKIEIICPLGYPETKREYRETVISRGWEYFGDRFKPLTKVIDYDEYEKLLDTVDVLVFNHLRQQGLFNLMYIIFQGKKAFLRKETTTYSMLKEMKISVYDTKSIGFISFEEFASLPSEIRNININTAKDNLSREKSILCWKDLFNKYYYNRLGANA